MPPSPLLLLVDENLDENLQCKDEVVSLTSAKEVARMLAGSAKRGEREGVAKLFHAHSIIANWCKDILVMLCLLQMTRESTRKVFCKSGLGLAVSRDHTSGLPLLYISNF